VFFAWECEILISRRRRRRGSEGRERDLAGMKTTCGDSKSIAGKRASAEPREKEGKEREKKEKGEEREVCGGDETRYHLSVGEPRQASPSVAYPVMFTNCYMYMLAGKHCSFRMYI
jgi:hypothetical protein